MLREPLDSGRRGGRRRGGGRTALLAVALVALLRPFAANAVEAEGDRVALVIGNSQYQELEPVPGAGDDARTVAAALRDLDFTVIELFDGTRGEMSAAVQRFAGRLSPGAVALFYYAGHGVQFQGRNFLLPVSAELRGDFSVLTEGVLADSVLAAMAASGAEVKLLLLDASRRNRFVESSDSLSPGLAEMTAGAAGTIIVYAASPGRTAIEDGAAGSAFADALAALLSEPVVEINQLLETLPARVAAATDGRQVPWISAAPAGALFLRPPATPAEASVEAPAGAPMAPAEPAPAGPQGRPALGGDAEGAPQPAEAPDAAPEPASETAPAQPPGKAPKAGLPAAAAERPSGTVEPAAIDTGPAGSAKTAEPEPGTKAQAGGAEATLQAIEAALDRDDKRRVQASLARLGYYDGEIDGIFGPGTRHAIRAYQKAADAPQTGWLSVAQLHRLLQPADRAADQRNLNSIETRLPDPAPHAVPHRRRPR